ncbi:unnamed protein product [Adineta steineri]|uniref:VLIG-type G domain-containing protein n=2 Tax=Adineta steineri TaxID=433720 RepID=A0A819DW00_9BILA|nr:unnamed protein product [Adineta steineri]
MATNSNNIKSFVLMWCDPSVNSNEENIQAQKTFAKIYDRFYTFPTIDECENAIKQLSTTDRVSLIISGGFGTDLLPRIHELTQVSMIYIFCISEEKYTEWAKSFNKIKAIIADMNKLISTVQYDYEHRFNVLVKNSKPESQTTHTKNNGTTFQYTSEYFFGVGELQYADKTIEDIANEIVDRFKNDSYRDFNALISETAQLLMYLLKREQNLTNFSDILKVSLIEEKNIPCFNLRRLIDNIMINSDQFLCRRLISLLSKRNPVPLIQPCHDSTNNEYRSISSIIHVWDYHRPVLLSFGIGICTGKTSLINTIFYSNFELSVIDGYFANTIDVDFGYQFSERRPINIADSHGAISNGILSQISILFNGFLIHIKSKYLCANSSDVIKYLELLAPQSYIVLLIRDVDDDDDKEIQTVVEKVTSSCSNYRVYYLPNDIEKKNIVNEAKIKKVRENIFRDVGQHQCCSEELLREHLINLMDNTQKVDIQQEMTFINSIRSILIDGKEENYPVYSSFTNLCKKRLEVFKIDPYGRNFQDETLHRLNLDLFCADSDFKEKLRKGSRAYGDGFDIFFNLLQNEESRLIKLNLLSIELKKERAKKDIDQEQLPFYDQLSLEIHWRNAMICSAGLSGDNQKRLVQAYRDYLVEGNPFEIVDGDNFEMQNDFLAKVMELFPNKKFFVISIVGQQNSGKSTLLNFLFGTLFETRSGRCTKGVYGTLINVQNITSKNNLIPLDYDYILLIDTEGILSIQKNDKQYDRKLILFCLAISHLMIVNVDGEINEIVKDFFISCTQALKYLGETRVIQPTVHFVLNKRPIRDENYCVTLFEYVRKTLNENKLDDVINLEQENFYVLSTAFNRDPTKILNGKCNILSTDMDFVTDVQKLGKIIINSSSDIIRRTGDRFCKPTNWIEFANRVLQTIKKHPDLTRFQDAFERNQYNKIRDSIRKDFDQHLTVVFIRFLMEKNKKESPDHIKVYFKNTYDQMFQKLKIKLEKHCDDCQASETVSKCSLDFMRAQLSNIFCSWEISTQIASKRHKIDQIVNNIDNKLHAKAISVTHKNCLMDEQSAKKMFDEELHDIFNEIENQFDSKNVWEQWIDIVFHLLNTFGEDVLPSENNVLIYLEFLKTLDDSPDKRISMDNCLAKINEKFISDTSNINPLAAHLIHKSSTILRHEIQQIYKYLNNDELSRIFISPSSDGKMTREAVRKGTRQLYSQLFNENWKKIVQISNIFNILLADLKQIFKSTNSNESSTEIHLAKKVLEKVNNIIQDCNKELNIFNFCLSKEFCSTLYTYAVVGTTLYYYNEQKTHIIHILERLRENKSKSIERFLPWVVLMENDDQKVAIDCVNKLLEALCRSAELQLKEAIEKHIHDKMSVLNRRSIIEELDHDVYNAEDDWLKRYVLHFPELIIERLNEKWITVKEATDAALNTIVNSLSTTLDDIFHLIEAVNRNLQEQKAHSLIFVDSLFKLKDEQMITYANDKQFCMAKLLYFYLVDEDIPAEIYTRNNSIYIVDSKWRTISSTFPKPSAEIKQIFSLLRNEFEMFRIRYLGKFLETILNQQNKTKDTIQHQIKSFIKAQYLLIKEQLDERVRGCQERCPCCKRICDVDHYSNSTSPVGQGENKHRCQSGHQIRAMGGIYYETTHEASLSRCEFIKDDDLVTTNNNKLRQTWKNFKNANAHWNFDEDLEVCKALETPYGYIWERIGEQLCHHFANGMKFVKRNSLQPVNHYIFILDHSGSMNHKNSSNNSSFWRTLTGAVNNANETNISPWEHLRQAVQGFIDIRIRQVSLNDQITIILFATRAEKIYDREKLIDIDLDRINTPMNIYGHGTNFSAAFKVLIETLEEINNHDDRDTLRQTIVFMTDGEPQGDSSVELQQLCNYRTDNARGPSTKALIHNFWTMALGNFNKKVIKKINETLQGQIVDIEHAEDLEEAYAQIAEIL